MNGDVTAKFYEGSKSVFDLMLDAPPEVGKVYVNPKTKQSYRVQSAHETTVKKVWRAQVTEC